MNAVPPLIHAAKVAVPRNHQARRRDQQPQNKRDETSPQGKPHGALLTRWYKSRDFEVPHSPAASVTALKAARRAAALSVERGSRRRDVDAPLLNPRSPSRPWSTVGVVT